MINRREFLGTSLSAGAALALNSDLVRAFQQSGGLRQAQAVPSLSRGGTLMQRAIPSSGEMLPVISFAPRPPADPAGFKDILKTLLDNSGKIVDVLHEIGRAHV